MVSKLDHPQFNFESRKTAADVLKFNPSTEENASVNKTETGGYIVFGTVFELGENYEIVSPIGQGAYGVVVAAKIKNPGAINATSEPAAEVGGTNQD